MKLYSRKILLAVSYVVLALSMGGSRFSATAQTAVADKAAMPMAKSRKAGLTADVEPESANYKLLQRRLARGWNTWDTHSVTTQVLLPEGLAIHVGFKHNATLWGGPFLQNVLIDRREANAEQVTPGPHSWDGSYTDLRFSWKGDNWRIQSAHVGGDLVLLATPLPAQTASALPPTIIISVDYLWNLPGTTLKHPDFIETHSARGAVPVYCTCENAGGRQANEFIDMPTGGSYFAADVTEPVGVSTGKRRTLAEIEAAIERQRVANRQTIEAAGQSGPMVDGIETTLGWNTIFEPEKHRVITPISRLWSTEWGGYILPDWDTFFVSTLASVGDRDLAYANAVEMLREETPQGFVPNYARPDGWKSFDRSEPPVGAITVLGLYKKYGDRWLLEETYKPLMRWNRWWAEHRDNQGYLSWGNDGDNQPENLDDSWRGTRYGAILESGLDNSPMYDKATYNKQTHMLEFADVGLMGMYIADCDALAQIADTLGKSAEAKELRERSSRYRAKLATLWDEKSGIFLNKDLHTGEFSMELSPTNFYPMLAHAATPAQASSMVEKHLLNPKEFWGEWVIPSISRDDPAFADQSYWRGRIWGPMNYLVYLGLLNYDDAEVRKEFAQKSYNLFLKEWTEKGHVHENYNAITGMGDDVRNSDRFYHWGALLAYVEYMEREGTGK